MESSLAWDKPASRLYLATVEEVSNAIRLYLYPGPVEAPILLADSTKDDFHPLFPSVIAESNRVFVACQLRPNPDAGLQKKDAVELIVFDAVRKAVLIRKRVGDKDTAVSYPQIALWQDRLFLLSHQLTRESFWLNFSGFDPVSLRQKSQTLLESRPDSLPSLIQNESTLFIFQRKQLEDKRFSTLRTVFLPNDKPGEERDFAGTGAFQNPQIYLAGSVRKIIYGLGAEGASRLWEKTEDISVEAPAILSTPDPNIWFADKKRKIVWEAPPDVSGISGFGFALNQRPTSSPPVENLRDYQTSFMLEKVLVPGTNYAHLAAYDQAGNVSPVTSLRMLYEPRPPVILSFSSPSHLEGVLSMEKLAVFQLRATGHFVGIKGFIHHFYPRRPTPEAVKQDAEVWAESRENEIQVIAPFAGTNIFAVSAVSSLGLRSDPIFFTLVISPRAKVHQTRPRPNPVVFQNPPEIDRSAKLREDFLYLESLPASEMKVEVKRKNEELILRELLIGGKFKELIELLKKANADIHYLYLGMAAYFQYFSKSESPSEWGPIEQSNLEFAREFVRTQLGLARKTAESKGMRLAVLYWQAVITGFPLSPHDTDPGTEARKNALLLLETILAEGNKGLLANDVVYAAWKLSLKLGLPKKAADYKALMKSETFDDREILDPETRTVIPLPQNP